MDKLRDEFEVWAKAQGYECDRAEPNMYYQPEDNRAWAAWQAALAARQPQPAELAEQQGVWPFVESPGEFTARLREAIDSYHHSNLLGAVRYVLVENPPTLAATGRQAGEVHELDFYREHIGNDLDNLLIGAGVLQVTHEGGYEACWQNTMDAVERLAATGKQQVDEVQGDALAELVEEIQATANDWTGREAPGAAVVRGFAEKARAALAATGKQQDGCTESNCRRCLTHPDHRGDMPHAGIGSTGKQQVGEVQGDARADAVGMGSHVIIDGCGATVIGLDPYTPRLEIEWDAPKGGKEYRPREDMTLAARPPGAQEPVGYMTAFGFVAYSDFDEIPVGTQFYAAPPAQGIDLGQFRPVAEFVLMYAGEKGLHRRVELAQRLLTLIDQRDAAPEKG